MSIAIDGPCIFHANSWAPIPTGDVERAGDMNTLNEFCYKNAEVGAPESSFSKRKAGITSVYNICENAKVPWNWLSTWNFRFSNTFFKCRWLSYNIYKWKLFFAGKIQVKLKQTKYMGFVLKEANIGTMQIIIILIYMHSSSREQPNSRTILILIRLRIGLIHRPLRV